MGASGLQGGARRQVKPTGVYQVAIIGPAAGAHRGALRKAVSRTVKILGLPPGQALRFLSEATLNRRYSTYPLVAVYFGGPAPTRASTRAAEVLTSSDIAVLPVVPTLEGFKEQVPESLHPINGVPLDPDDPELIRIAQWVAQALGLDRERRFSFISYRRDEATRFALQLHQEMDARGWRSFLDTHSVGPAVDFQNSLWDQMNDADLLILLDSPNALNSTWVRQEIARADQLGIGVLQLVWPGHSRDPLTAFSVPYYLETSDFGPGKLSRRGGLRLRQAPMQKLLVEAERLRARTIAARNDRLIRAFSASSRSAGLTVSRTTPTQLEVIGKQGAYVVHPVVGHVSSTAAFRAEKSGLPAAGRTSVLLYDQVGLLEERVDEILWLDKHLPVKSVAVQATSTWARRA